MNCDQDNIFSSLLQSTHPEINQSGKLDISVKGNNSHSKAPKFSECDLEQSSVTHAILPAYEHASDLSVKKSNTRKITRKKKKNH